MNDQISESTILELAAELTAAWLANPNSKISSEELPAVIEKIHAALAGLSSTPAELVAAELEYTPAVTVRRSLSSKDHIISLIDGKPYKMLKRHLNQNGLTPAEYRERYGLKSDYPMVAESYAEKRRALAKKIGLGRKPGTKVVSAKAAAKSAGKAAAPAISSAPAPAAAPAAKPKAPRRAKAAKPANPE